MLDSKELLSHATRLQLQLLCPDIQTGKLSTIIATDVFGTIRSLAASAFRLTGGTKALSSFHLSSYGSACSSYQISG
ncbi:hypothetical protein BGY98DRAFT_387768 [Russula aff. rugulosa BPL654]|nr:hypothetical protein BGY98DRAFT_387768 [Russula aff. rugulosa BPL654]